MAPLAHTKSTVPAAIAAPVAAVPEIAAFIAELGVLELAPPPPPHPNKLITANIERRQLQRVFFIEST